MVIILDGSKRRKIGLFGENKIGFVTALDLIKFLKQRLLLYLRENLTYKVLYYYIIFASGSLI